MRIIIVLSVSLSFVWLSLGATPSALATPTIYQCSLPTQQVGNSSLRGPVPLPKNGDFVINFQRSGTDATQATINLSEIKDVQQFADRIAKSINDEATQRAPKMASIRERGLDDVKNNFVAGALFITLNEIYRFLMVYDAAAVQISFQAPSTYSISCEALGLIAEIPDLTNVSIETKPKVLFVALPEKFKHNQATTIAVAFNDKEDDVGSIDIRYRSEDDSRNRGDASLGFTPLPLGLPSPFGAGLKAVKVKLTVQCETAQTFEATASAIDNKGNFSEPLNFKFNCEP